jgi:hypothetical protein
MKKALAFAIATALVALLSCSVSLAQQTSLKARLFDSYGRLIADDAGGHVDRFALQLQQERDKLGYVMCYGPSGNGSGTASFTLRMISDYLVNARGLDADRLRAVNGGHFKDPFNVLVEFWLVPIGASPPEPRHYENQSDKLTGKLREYIGWDGFADGDDGGPSQGNVTLAGFADVLKAQPDAIAYIVAFNQQNATIGYWRQVAKGDEGDIEAYGIAADRIKIIFGGTLKETASQDDRLSDAKIQLWVLPKDAAIPVKEAKESTPTKSVQIGTFEDYLLKDPEKERHIFQGFADVLRANDELSVCLIARPRSTPLETLLDDEQPEIDPQKLVAKWKTELVDKSGIKEGRVIVISAAADETNEGTIEIWVVPPGGSLPDPYASKENPSPTPFVFLRFGYGPDVLPQTTSSRAAAK